MEEKVKRVCLLCMFLLPLLLPGCSTQPSRFYLLEPIDTGSAAANLSDLVVGVGPVRLAGYLERPQIVSRIHSNRLEVEEFDRWGGSLETNVTWVVAENLSRRLGTDAVVTFPWERAVVPSYQVAIDIRRIDPIAENGVHLIAQWRITGEDGRKLLAIKTSSIREPLGGADLEEQIAAQSRALARMSDDIVAAIVRIRGLKPTAP